MKNVLFAGTVALILGACGGETSEAASGEESKLGATVDATSEGGKPIPAANEAKVMQELGFTKSDDGWSDPECDGPSYAELRDYEDLNGDGQPEAVVAADGDQCYGFNQRSVTIYRKTSGKWQELVSYSAQFMVDSWHNRKGIAWPDIEYFPGMEGAEAADGSINAAECVPFLRWNGKEYVDGGTSKNGKICQLAPEFAAATPKAAGGGFPPIPEGFYATNASCAEAASFGDAYVYFDRKNWIEIDGGSQVTGIKNTGGSNWTLELDGGGPPLKLTVTGPASFTEYGRTMTHCPTSGVPAQARKDFSPAG